MQTAGPGVAPITPTTAPGPSLLNGTGPGPGQVTAPSATGSATSARPSPAASSSSHSAVPQIVSDLASDRPAQFPAIPSTQPAPTSAAASSSPAPASRPSGVGMLVSNKAGRGSARISQPQSSAPFPSTQPPPAKPRMAQHHPEAGPDTGTSSQGIPPTSGFPSPGRDNSNIKFIDDRTRITFGIQQSVPEAVRRSVRDNWKKCLLGSEFHLAFVLNAAIHYATPAAIQRGIRDFGTAMIAAAKHSIVDMMTQQDLDEVADLILAKAGVNFFDKALEMRLKTIEAKKLINALARAERLGYDPSDVDEDSTQHAAPAAGHTPMPGKVPMHGGPSPVPNGPHLPSQPPQEPLPLHCSICLRRFTRQSAYDHHVKARVCTRTPSTPNGFKYNCQHCGQGFTTVMGLQYHNANKVCGDFGEPLRASPVPAAVPATPVPVKTKPNSTQYTTPIAPPTQPQAIPAPTGSIISGTPGLTSADGSISDPYAHLSPEQLAAMQQELREAELKYSDKMRQAMQNPNEDERRQKLDGLGNSFGTKQSLIRKKYGVRLRMRRTKAEIVAERDRMQYKTAAELQAELNTGLSRIGPGRPTAIAYRNGFDSTQNSSKPQNQPTSGGSWAAVNQPAVPIVTLASSAPVPQPKTENADMQVSMRPGKRQFGGDGELPQNKRTAYTDMGGLGGAAAEAETKDPTLLRGNPRAPGTVDEPVTLDDSGSDESESSSDSDNEDIPAQLPASVLQSLQRPGSVSLSRPSSNAGSS